MQTSFSDIHGFRDWLRGGNHDDADLDALYSGEFTIDTEHVQMHEHAGPCDRARRGATYVAGDYGYCEACDQILERYEGVYFRIDWDRRSRDGWLRVRDEREDDLRASAPRDSRASEDREHDVDDES